MNTRNGLRLALGAAALGTLLANGGAVAQGNRAGAASLPQVACASGVKVSAAAADAQAVINQTYLPRNANNKPALFQQAYDKAMAGTQADPNNPFNYFVAASASAGLNQPARADSLYARTIQLCPEFASEVEPQRKTLGGQAMESARVAIAEKHDTAAAISLWQTASQLDSTLTDASFYAAYFSARRGNLAAAIPSYRRLLAGPAPAATDTNAIERRNVALDEILGYAGQQINDQKYAEADAMLRDLQRIDPNNRNVLYYRSLALYKMERWGDLLPITEKVTQIDPLNENEWLIAFAAHKGLADAAKAQNNTTAEQQHRMAAIRLQNPDSLQVTVDQVGLAISGGSVTLRGVVKGAAARPGTAIKLEFTLAAPTGDVGTGTVTVAAPARGQTANFELPVQVTASPTTFRYRLVP
ncbi:tetratricopeptide repeat protein [Longimicrobium sp.]|uniref:tetratricopeptide repeat protein n=1 Tax=Longimicrobium sp. TaxID=2029185 RepID=UPI002B8AFF02|nr:tetratricopeptide repeat protein [Longimicrobium sp.]HSU14373.1 tetratricopeptide repeat protein [Longimicrobium sp.]